MKKYIQILVAAILLGSLTIQAEPLKTWYWQEPILYENSETIPAGDLVNYRLHCSNTAGGPYPSSQSFNSQAPPSIQDMAFIVNNTPGIYFCVATVESLAHGTTSGFSNEINFSVSGADLGYVPKAPVLSLQ